MSKRKFNDHSIRQLRRDNQCLRCVEFCTRSEFTLNHFANGSKVNTYKPAFARLAPTYNNSGFF